MNHSSSLTRTVPSAQISHGAAAALIDAALAAADALGVPVAVAVTDAGGELKAFGREDRAGYLTATIAVDKAWTAASFGVSTRDWTTILQRPMAAQLAHRPRFVAVGGGCPIVEAGQVVGAIGISGGDAEQDHRIATAALSQLGFAAAA